MFGCFLLWRLLPTFLGPTFVHRRRVFGTFRLFLAWCWPAFVCFWPVLSGMSRPCFCEQARLVLASFHCFWLASGLLLVCFCFALACLLLAYFCAQARRFMHVPFALGSLLACSWPALSGVRLASFWPFCCTDVVVCARLACSVWPASGSPCLACVVWVWPAVPGPRPENRSFLIEPLEE